jgi:hypothetical protein
MDEKEIEKITKKAFDGGQKYSAEIVCDGLIEALKKLKVILVSHIDDSKTNGREQ